ncbi:pilus assembly protein [Trinickia symbiotica]|uniref:pilus assembly protein n=1 Tax=Trinickia symbiotica TaxID=863227 RepID=UPI002159A38B|nr:pilus assembly protein [Trinickia symbiotica]
MKRLLRVRVETELRTRYSRYFTLAVCAITTLAASACAFKESGYGIGPQAERAAAMQTAANAQRESKPDTPGVYLALIDRMQAEGLYYASLAHIDAYEKQYGATPESTLLRADALRITGQADASASAYRSLLGTPLAARGYRGLGLLAGAAGDFADAGRELAHASELAPIDATTLSDLGYARLRDGDVAGARVPLMQAAELDAHNARILSNIALLLLAQGHTHEARALMDEQHFSPEVREAIRSDASKVAAVERARRLGPQTSLAKRQPRPESRQDPTLLARAHADATVADSLRGSAAAPIDQTPPPLLQQFAQ